MKILRSASDGKGFRGTAPTGNSRNLRLARGERRETGGGSLTWEDEFVPIGCVKSVLPALVAVVCALAACETTADHRDLYAPDKPRGPYTEKLRAINYARGSNREVETPEYAAATAATPAAQPAQETGPIAPPPPPPPPAPASTTPATEAGAPAATPMPETALPQTAAPSTVPGLSAPMATPASGAPSLAVPPAPAVPAATPAAGAGAGASPAPVIPGLSQ
jgi:hypothetical protein